MNQLCKGNFLDIRRMLRGHDIDGNLLRLALPSSTSQGSLFSLVFGLVDHAL